MARYPKLSEKIFSERNWLRCKEDWVAHAVDLERTIDHLRECDSADARRQSIESAILAGQAWLRGAACSEEEVAEFAEYVRATTKRDV